MRTPHRPKDARVAVWFDRPSDTLCFADRLDKRMADAKEGEPIPEACVVRIPLVDAEDFVEALVNHCIANAVAGEDFSKVMWGVQEILDRRVAQAASLSERLRGEMTRQSGGTASRSSQEATVRVEAWERFRALRDEVKRLLTAEAAGHSVGRVFDSLRDFYEEHRLDEP